MEGVCVISISFFFFFFFLLFRRRSARKRQFAEEFATGTQRPPSSFVNPLQASTSFHSFSKELLPYHVTRVYLFGRNDFKRHQLDWTPTPMQQEGRILVAHGFGTFHNPF